MATAATDSRDLGALPSWRLEDLYPGVDSEAYRADLARLLPDARSFAGAYRNRLESLVAATDGARALHDAIAAFEAMDDRMGRILSYAGLLYAGDTSNPVHGKVYGDAQEKVTEASTELVFFTLELNRLDDAVLDPLLAAPPLDRYAPWIRDIRRERPYQLDDRLERLFHEKAIVGRAAWNRLFDETVAALRFDVRGERLALEPTLNLLLDADPDMRRAAAEALAATFTDNLRVFTLITNVLAKDKEIADRWRGFRDSADSRHLANRVEPEVVEALVAAVRAAYPRLSHRYYRLKARWFGRESLDHWDRNAPLPHVPQRTIPWEEARATVLEAYAGFDTGMAAVARRFFDEGWIDAPVRPGKSPGAFAHPTVPSAHPYVMLNYLGKPRDVMTLAHELGHGVHQVLAAPRGALLAPTPLTLAETASVFGEMLTFRAILAKTANPLERKALLAQKVEDMINTVVRQIAFYTFERKVHEARRHGELTAEQLGAFWLEVQRESLGPAITLHSGYETFWSYIPHFVHSPFYVYAYAFGDCLVNSLFGVYERAHPRFVEHYFALLEAGGSKPYGELLAPFGLDARDPAFWQIGLGVIDRMIGELEALD